VSTLIRSSSLRRGVTPEPSSIPDRGGVREEGRLRDGAVPPSPPAGRLAPEDADESLVADPRASLTPSQMVERKLLTLLDGRALPVSQVQMVVLPRIHHGK
jgi:hypothetical protein